jgi:hypothetical protein
MKKQKLIETPIDFSKAKDAWQKQKEFIKKRTKSGKPSTKMVRGWRREDLYLRKDSG